MALKNFYDTKRAFALKSDTELTKTFWLFKLINSPLVSRMFTLLLKLSLKLNLPIKGLIKATIFDQFCGGESLGDSNRVVQKLYNANVKSILDYSVEGEESEGSFNANLREVLNIINLANANTAIPYTSIKLTGFVRTSLLEKKNEGLDLTPDEINEWDDFLDRIDTICMTAEVNSVPVFIDAEESWIQQAIDDLTEELMLRYNKKKPIVLTTLQMYRHDRIAYLQKLITNCRREKIYLGVKLVRGAYLEKETERAREKSYSTPIQPSKQKTDEDFNRAVKICLDNIDIIMLCAGTHNEESTLFLLEEMKKRNLPNNHQNVYFSQLYGMSDHITLNLAAENYNVTKYLPYGPLKSVVPYLIRRANENTSIAGQMSRELDLVTQEKHRRKRQKLITQK